MQTLSKWLQKRVYSRFLAKARCVQEWQFWASNLVMAIKYNRPGSAQKDLNLPCDIFDEREQVIKKFCTSEFVFIN
jgi:hypothetical protein